MNYIEEELRRQAAAFASLLGGGTDREKGTAEKDTDRGRMQAAEGAGDGALRRCPTAQTLKRDPAGEMAEWNRMLRCRSAQNFRQAVNALGLTETEAEAETAAAERTQAAGTGQEPAGARMGRDENSAAVIRTEAGSGTDTVRRMGRIAGNGGAMRNFGDSAETVFVVDGGMSAGELSRTFQRDARRYDGEYPLY